MSRSGQIIYSIAFVACLIMPATPASAFKVGRDQDGKVVVWDNDFLNRRFGRTWVPGRGAVDKTSPGGDAMARSTEERWSETKPHRSLLTAINRATPPRRAAALRLAETGRTSLQSGEHQRAVYYLEKALGVDAGPFMHFYLARAHYELADYQRSLRFLEVAESGLNGRPDWLRELEILKRDLSTAHRAPPQAAIGRDADLSGNP
jgi:hypothetical protein